MFKKFNENKAAGMLRANTGGRRQIANNNSELLADIEAGRGTQVESKDDVFHGEKKTGEFGDNQYWTAPAMYDIDQLLSEQDD